MPLPGAPRPPTLGWALRRAALGVALLILFIGASAWLFYASIDPNDVTTVGADASAPIFRP